MAGSEACRVGPVSTPAFRRQRVSSPEAAGGKKDFPLALARGNKRSAPKGAPTIVTPGAPPRSAGASAKKDWGYPKSYCLRTLLR